MEKSMHFKLLKLHEKKTESIQTNNNFFMLNILPTLSGPE